jgi:hypothetical protein
MANFPMMLGFDAIFIVSTMIGTEVTPLMTALQKSALIGSIDVRGRRDRCRLVDRHDRNKR